MTDNSQHDTRSLEEWIDGQYAVSANRMRRSISATGITKERPGFGTVVTAARGSVVASPVLGSYDPDPDYFFHWYRDSAVVMDALLVLLRDGLVEDDPAGIFADFLRFNLSLRALDGRVLASDPSWRGRVREDFVQFLRPDEDLAAAHGEAVSAETRINPDGTLDISRWPRPQNDGPAQRALTVLRWLAHLPDLEPALAEDAAALLKGDLDYTLRHWREPCFDIWEEEKGYHYYTLRLQASALQAGAIWLDARGDAGIAAECRQAVANILVRLDDFWSAEDGHYHSRLSEAGGRSPKALDMAMIFAVLHSGADDDAHSLRDPKMVATLERLEALFDADYPINHGRPPGRGPAMGRYHGDAYYSGGAYFFSTLAAAEFHFRQAALDATPGHAATCLRRGDAILETVRAYTTADGALSEQFDQTDGHQTSARDLAWSYAAFITCVEARKAAVAAA